MLIGGSGLLVDRPDARAVQDVMKLVAEDCLPGLVDVALRVIGASTARNRDD